MSWTRRLLCSTSSNASRSTGNAAPNSTTPFTTPFVSPACGLICWRRLRDLFLTGPERSCAVQYLEKGYWCGTCLASDGSAMPASAAVRMSRSSTPASAALINSVLVSSKREVKCESSCIKKSKLSLPSTARGGSKASLASSSRMPAMQNPGSQDRVASSKSPRDPRPPTPPPTSPAPTPPTGAVRSGSGGRSRRSPPPGPASGAGPSGSSRRRTGRPSGCGRGR